MDDNGYIVKRNWEKVLGNVSENDIDVRWILREENDERAYGSLRIVSHPDLKPGYLRAFSSFVTKRTKKTPEEIEETLREYQMKDIELEVYSINEHIETMDSVLEDRFQDLEKLYGVKIFK